MHYSYIVKMNCIQWIAWLKFLNKYTLLTYKVHYFIKYMQILCGQNILNCSFLNKHLNRKALHIVRHHMSGIFGAKLNKDLKW